MSTKSKYSQKSIINELIEREAECTWRDEPNIAQTLFELGFIENPGKRVVLDVVWEWLDTNPSKEDKLKVLKTKGYDISILK